MKGYFIIAVLSLICTLINGHGGKPDGFLSVLSNNQRWYYLGIEFSELAQNKFRDLGKDNYTFVAGQRFGKERYSKLGWRYLIIIADLSPEHIQNPNQVAYIEGNRQDLTGDVHAQRLCMDYYPVSVGIGYIRKWDRYVLEVSPVLYGAIGYNDWGFTNTLYNENYRLKAMTIGGGVRLQSVLFRNIFIENPLFDLFTYVIKNRPVQGAIGDTQITRPDSFGMFSWATIGYRFSLQRKS